MTGIAGAIMAIKDTKAKITLLRITSLLQAIPAFILVIPIIPFLGIGFFLAMVVIVEQQFFTS